VVDFEWQRNQPLIAVLLDQDQVAQATHLMGEIVTILGIQIELTQGMISLVQSHMIPIQKIHVKPQ
jgi:hypothetical protein